MVHISVPRFEAERINSNPGWSLVYGRRKVGKTYLINNFVPHDANFYVRLNRSISASGYLVDEIGDLEVFRNGVISLLKEGKTVVIDEFQRLPMNILEDIARVHPTGKLILTGSSMRVANKILGRNSPLLGLLMPIRIEQITPVDLLNAVSPTMGPVGAIEYGPFLRDPWTIEFYRPSGFVRSMVEMMPYTVPGLIGEVFSEDERELTKIYSSILSLLGKGHTDYKEIGNILHSRELVSSPSSSSVVPFMKTMVEMGLLERIPRFRSKKFVYQIPSFPIRAYYYIESRYRLSDFSSSLEEIRPSLSMIHDLAIEDMLADLMAQVLGGTKTWLKDSEKEIDILITKRDRPVLVGEVKWGKTRRSDISKFLDKVEDLDCRKVMISKVPVDSDELEILTPERIVEIAMKGPIHNGEKSRY